MFVHTSVGPCRSRTAAVSQKNLRQPLTPRLIGVNQEAERNHILLSGMLPFTEPAVAPPLFGTFHSQEVSVFYRCMLYFLRCRQHYSLLLASIVIGHQTAMRCACCQVADRHRRLLYTPWRDFDVLPYSVRHYSLQIAWFLPRERSQCVRIRLNDARWSCCLTITGASE